MKLNDIDAVGSAIAAVSGESVLGSHSSQHQSASIARYDLRRSTVLMASAACLVLALSGCGGGGGDTAVAAVPKPPTDGGGGATTLQTHLAACPNTFTIGKTTPCMIGLYEGKATDSGAYCAFRYDSDGESFYITRSHTLRLPLSFTSSMAQFEKKAASNSAGFAINWSIGIASGSDIDIYYWHADTPTSANGLLIQPKKAGVPACLVETGPAAVTTGGDSINLLGRNWQSPKMLNGSNGAVGSLADQPAFDAGLADDGRAFVTFRQPDANGRVAVQVVQGQPGAAGQEAVWTAPQVLDAEAPLLTGSSADNLAGNLRPRIAVSSTGHAVVSWMTVRPCEADAYEVDPTGKTCRYLYASRRLASETTWEVAKRVRASPPMAAQDHFARINARGDVVLFLSGPDPRFIGVNDSASTLAIRHAVDDSYRAVPLFSFRSNPLSTAPFGEQLQAGFDDAANLFLAGKARSSSDLAQLRTTTLLALDGSPLPATSISGSDVFALRTGGNGYAAYSWSADDGTRLKPSKLTVYSPESGAWLATYDINPYTLWGDTDLVGTDAADGEFLLYSGCRLTAWRAGTWGTTRALPAYCGRDQAGGVYAFNRKGDYLGVNWAGQPGQWGYYSYAQDKMLKGAPGSGDPAGGDYVLGTPSKLFGAAPTQLMLASNGLALAVTTNAYTTLPSAANPAGTTGGAATKLWAIYLK